MIEQMWPVLGYRKRLGDGLGKPQRSIYAVIRWYHSGRPRAKPANTAAGVDAAEDGDLRKLETVKVLHRQPQLLARFESSLIRNFRSVRSLTLYCAVHLSVLAFNASADPFSKFLKTYNIYRAACGGIYDTPEVHDHGFGSARGTGILYLVSCILVSCVVGYDFFCLSRYRIAHRTSEDHRLNLRPATQRQDSNTSESGSSLRVCTSRSSR